MSATAEGKSASTAASAAGPQSQPPLPVCTKPLVDPADGQVARCELVTNHLHVWGESQKTIEATNTRTTYTEWWSSRTRDSFFSSSSSFSSGSSTVVAQERAVTSSGFTFDLPTVQTWHCEHCKRTYWTLGDDATLHNTDPTAEKGGALVHLGAATATAVAAHGPQLMAAVIGRVNAAVNTASGKSEKQLAAEKAELRAKVPPPAPQPCTRLSDHLWEPHPDHKAALVAVKHKRTITTTALWTGTHTVASIAADGSPVTVADDMLYCTNCGHAATPDLQRTMQRASSMLAGAPEAHATLAALQKVTPGALLLAPPIAKKA